MRVAAVALLSGAACWFSLHFTQTPCGIALMWPANGLLLAVLLCTPRGHWPAYVALTFSANLATAFSAHHVPARALPLACCNVAEVTIAALALNRCLGRAPDLSAAGAYARFLVIGTGLAPAGCALLQAGILKVWWHAPFALAWAACFVAHSLGTAVVAPTTIAVLRTGRSGVAEVFGRERRRRTVAWLMVYHVVVLAVFSQSRYPLLFVVPPLLLATVAELGAVTIAFCIPSLAAVGCLATAFGSGPFTVNPHLTQFERIILVQLFIFAALLMSARVARLLGERQCSHAALQAERDRVVESEARYRLLTEHALDVVVQADACGRYVYWSPSAVRIYGRSPETLLDMQPRDFVHPDDIEGLEALRTRLLSGAAEEGRCVYRLQGPPESKVWIEAQSRLLRHPVTGAPDGFVSVGRDVTERILLEIRSVERERQLQDLNGKLQDLTRHLGRARDQAEQASQAKSRFLAGVSHELRTPLNGLLGHAQLLRIEGSLSAGQSARVGAMLDAGTHLLEMINSVLDLSQIEAERMEFLTASIDVVSMTRACLDLVRPSAEAKGLSLAQEVAREASVAAMADPTRVRQVLLNLLGNAIKFTARGGVLVRIRQRDHLTVRIEIADTGPGIPANLRPRLFQNFDRLDVDAVSRVEGAGLGLALSFLLATRMGGSLGHDDRPGGGSLFWVELPSGDVTVIPTFEPKLAPRPNAAALRILVVDDMAMNRDIACALLRSLGHQAIEAGGGSDAIEAVRTSNYDVVVMDVRMPGIDGLEATRRIRALDEGCSTIAIVALTAQAFVEQIELCRSAGMDSHATKPVTRDALMDAIIEARRCAAARLCAGTETASAQCCPTAA